MARIPFEPYGFADELIASADYAYADKHIIFWNGIYWEMLDDEHAKSMALKWIVTTGIGHHRTANNAGSAVSTAKLALPQLSAPTDDVIVPTLNGYVLVTPSCLALTPHDKTKCLRHVVRCNFNPQRLTPNKFMTFIERVLPDRNVRAYVQEYMGYTLIADARFQRAQIWLGNGANGKGVLANILQALHAKTASVYLDELDGFKLAPLVSASLIYCDEAPERKLKQNRLKSLIAGETVSIDQKFKEIISKGITAKWLILSNHIPNVSDHSEGFWRRFDIVPFPVHIPEGERDPMLAKDIIRVELGGVLNWVLEGLMRLLARGQFDPKQPEPMQKTKLSARIATNSVAAWADDAVVVRTTVAETSRSKAYRQYKEWCCENGVAAESAIQFWRALDMAIGPLMDSRLKTLDGYVRTANICLST